MSRINSKALLLLFLLGSTCAGTAIGQPPTVTYDRDDHAGTLAIRIDDSAVVTYQYSPKFAIPHYWPLKSPSGKLLTEQRGEPFPHHRSVWIADHVQAEGLAAVDFYHCWKNQLDSNNATPGYRHFIRHRQLESIEAQGQTVTVVANLQWVVDQDILVLSDTRTLHFIALEGGEYLLDLEWQLAPVDRQVVFKSDWVHYAWPYIRMHPQFSVQQGGTLMSDRGQTGQRGTNNQQAKWIDYCNTIDGVTEGLAVFVYPDAEAHHWLTRDYGTFGPRRPQSQSGTQFTLEVGQQVGGRVGLYSHHGEAASDRVADMYNLYISGKL